MASIDFFTFLLALGVFQGISLILILLFKRKYHNKYLITVLFVLTFSSFVSFSWRTGSIISYPRVIGVSTSLLYLLGPAHLFYIRSIFGARPKVLSIFIHSIPFFISVILLLPYYMESIESKLAYINSRIDSTELKFSMQRALIHGLLVAHILYYLIKSNQFINRFTNNHYRKFRFWKNWIKTLNMGLLLLTLSYFVVFILYSFTGINSVIYRDVSLICITIFIHMVAYVNIFGSDALNRNGVVDLTKELVHSSHWRNELSILMRKEQLFLDPKLKIEQVANSLHISSNKLSEFINREFDMNYNDYINQFRVDKVKEILLSRDQQIYDLEGIAAKTGFTSRSNLTRVFKKLTGHSPTEYRHLSVSHKESNNS